MPKGHSPRSPLLGLSFCGARMGAGVGWVKGGAQNLRGKVLQATCVVSTSTEPPIPLHQPTCGPIQGFLGLELGGGEEGRPEYLEEKGG